MSRTSDMEPKWLYNRMTGEARPVRTPEDVHAAFAEFADPWRNLRVAVRQWAQRRFGWLLGSRRASRE